MDYFGDYYTDEDDSDYNPDYVDSDYHFSDEVDYDDYFEMMSYDDALNLADQLNAASSSSTSRPQTTRPQTTRPQTTRPRRRIRKTESKADYQLRKSVLCDFKCPFLAGGHCYRANKTGRMSCGFSHKNDAVPLPPYACVYSLIKSCQATDPAKCPSGFHITIEELVDREEFEKKNQDTIKLFFGFNHDLECNICLEKVCEKPLPRNRVFGLLIECSHVFCAKCIRQWRCQTKECPVCRVTSEKVLFNSQYIANRSEKLAILGLNSP